MKFNERYYVKIVPHRGQTVHRFEVTRRHIVTVAVLLGVVTLGMLGLAGLQTFRAHIEVVALRAQSQQQVKSLQRMGSQTAALRSQIQTVQKQNQEIQQLIGVKPHKSATKVTKMSLLRRPTATVAAVSNQLDELSYASAETLQVSDVNRTLAMRILNIRHVQALARARALAAIPSIDPVAGAQVVGCFCYRTSPDVEFHKGVDLGADYGETVRAAAAGTVASAGWDGSYGEKVVVDHGNGYQTWYAHLSRIDVSVGQRVYKGQPIALVGSTGFSTGPHLHYQLMHYGVAIDPTPFLTGVPANVLASLP